MFNDAHGWRYSVSGALQLWQRMTGYSVNTMGPGWRPGQSGLTPIISQWAPDYGGPVRYIDHLGNERHNLPSTIEAANRAVGYHSDLVIGEMLWNPWAGEEVGHRVYAGGWVRYSKTLADKIAGAGYSLRVSKQQQQQTQGRPTFAGGAMYSNVVQGLYDMWDASRQFKGEGYKENVGIFTSKGLLVLPNTGNMTRSPYKPLGSFRFLGSIISKDQTKITYGGVELEILGMVHTHPDPSGLQGHSPYDKSPADWLYAGGQIGSFVISHYGIYQGQTDLVASTYLGPLNDKTINDYIISKYRN